MIPIILVIFGDMDSAANAALTVALDCPRQYECGGVIDEDSGRSDPWRDGRDDEVVHFTSGREIYLTCGHISGWIEEARAPALDAWALAAHAARHPADTPELADGPLGLWHASSQNEYNGHDAAD